MVGGSITSEDGQTFLFHVKREDGSGLMLGFPRDELRVPGENLRGAIIAPRILGLICRRRPEMKNQLAAMLGRVETRH